MSRFQAGAVALLLVALTAVPAAAQTAQLQDVVTDVTGQWESDPVVVDPSAEEALDPGTADRLREAIRAGDAGPIYVAVLPGAAADAAGGDPGALLEQLFSTFGRDGTYLLIVGANIQVASTTLPADDVRPVVEDARAGATSAGPLLLEIVNGLGEVAGGGSTSTSAPADGDGGAGGVLGVLALLGLGAGGVALVRARRRNAERDQRMQEIRAAALEDLASLDRGIRELEMDLALQPADSQAKGDQVAALESYAQASAAVDAARRPQDFQRVSELVDEGQFAVATARARLEGKPLPERTAPCFFDARHGPSVREVRWAPPGGAPRMVPACAADALRVEEGEQPDAREVVIDGRRRPYYDAPGYWGPWAGGHYGYANAGLFEGFLLGSLLSGGWGWGGLGWGGGVGGGWGGGTAGGDFGGGDFGGGDFGGGDFGGGDF